MPIETHLGFLRLCHAKAGLQLSLAATAKASGSLPIETNAFSDYSKAIVAESHPSWLSRGNNLCFVIVISASDAGLISLLREQDLLQSLGELLSEAELFQQLGLRTQLSIHPSLGSETQSELGSIEIQISHKKDVIDSKRPHHRLLRGVPAADLKPPEKIQNITLEEVHLSIHIDTFHQTTRTKIACKKSKPHRLINNSRRTDKGRTLDRNSNFQDDDMLDKTSHEHDILLFDTSPFNCFLEAHQLDDVEMLDSSATSSTHSGESASDRKLNREENDQFVPIASSGRPTFESTGASIQKVHAIDLIDAGFRMTLSDKPTNLARGIKQMEAGFPTRLSEIAPALFSPGYLCALSQRAVFIPTISRALATRISTHATSPSLKSKLARLASCDDPCDAVGGRARRGTALNSDEATTQTVHDAVKTCLWRIAQNTLRSPAAARRLKPIRDLGEGKDRVSAGRGDILERAAAVIPPAWDRKADTIDDDDDDDEYDMLSDGEDGYRENAMLSDCDNDEILQGYEDGKDDLLEDEFGEVALGEFGHQRLLWASSENRLVWDMWKEDEDILHSPSLIPLAISEHTEFGPTSMNDSIHDEMLI